MNENITSILTANIPAPIVSNKITTLYDIFANSGLSFILIIFVGIRWLISVVGIILNLLLFWITIRTKSLNSCCNYLIAIDALFTAIYQTSNSISMFVVLTGINFINLDICFYLMIYSILSTMMTTCLTFFIGFDRLLSVLFPFIFGSNEYSRRIIIMSTSISAIYAFFMIWESYQLNITIPKTPVICSISDCFQQDVGQMSFRNSFIIIAFSTLNYILICILIKYRSSTTLFNKSKFLNLFSFINLRNKGC
uniref:G-protein coupled receptors family 1 profile domain-containing protein n=1 Tax=Meloidogyne enterolobii TaxID=390850 RepID=A0A6V7UFF1_MELEN|nr:unnamed protein product [Meloidogyne enterolobii]